MKIKINNALDVYSADFNVDGITVVSQTSKVLNGLSNRLKDYSEFVINCKRLLNTVNKGLGSVSISEDNLSISTVFDHGEMLYNTVENRELLPTVFIDGKTNEITHFNSVNYNNDLSDDTVSFKLLEIHGRLLNTVFIQDNFITYLMNFVFDSKRSTHSTVVISHADSGLHPDYQLLLAEFLVLLQKESNVKFILETFSPYLINAIEVYSEKYDVACNFVQGRKEEEGLVFEDLLSNNDKLFDDLVKPLQTLENIKWSFEDYEI